MKKKYTKKQITEAIAYWEKQLNESNFKLLRPTMCVNDLLQYLLECNKNKDRVNYNIIIKFNNETSIQFDPYKIKIDAVTIDNNRYFAFIQSSNYKKTLYSLSVEDTMHAMEKLVTSNKISGTSLVIYILDNYNKNNFNENDIIEIAQPAKINHSKYQLELEPSDIEVNT